MKNPQYLMVAALMAAVTSAFATIPNAPGNLQGMGESPSEIALSWTDNSDNEIGFRVYRSYTPGGPFIEVDTVPANTTAVKAFNLATESGYYFQITAFNEDGESDPSDSAYASTTEGAAAGLDWFWWEGENYDRSTAPRDTSFLSPSTQAHRDVLSAEDGFGFDSDAGEQASGFAYVVEWDLQVPADGTYFLYVRKPWNYSWFGWSFGDGPITTVDSSRSRLEDINYKPNFPMSWVEIGTAELTAGAHTFKVHLDTSLFPGESRSGASLSNYFYDAFVASQQAFTPAGKLRPGAKLGLVEAGKWNFEPDSDPYSQDALLDLRYLNEAVAGQSGFVTRSGERFLLGDGRSVRFWGVSLGNHDSNYASMRKQAEFLAKRGVNIVRYHASLYDNGAPTMSYVDPQKVDNIYRTVAAFKESGIYTTISQYFVLGLRIQPEWGIDGYDEAWVAGHDRAPFGNMFWDEDMTEAYRDWMRAVYDTVNPYNGIRLADDPAVAFIELQNEDNMFFWTMDMGQLPSVQRQKLEGLFHSFIIDKHGSREAAETAWGGAANKGRDNWAEGRLEVFGAWDMGYGQTSGPSDRRMADMIEFYGKLQYDWFANMRSWMEQELGVKALFSASNWATSRNEVLLDLERYTYTGAGVIDLHNYYAPVEDEGPRSWVVEAGDRYVSAPAVYAPDSMSLAYEQVKDHPSFISEFTWVNPSDYAAEGPLLTAAVAAMNDVDGLTWFSSRSLGYSSGVEKWPVATPTILGQFPGTALLFRRGDTQHAPVLVAEGRSLQSIYDREISIITQGRGFDPIRDAGVEQPPGQSLIDTLAFVVGKVEVDFEGDEDFVDEAALSMLIDREGGTASSATGELAFDMEDGLFRLDTSRSQGVAGFLGDAGPVPLSDVEIASTNEFGSVLVISLDDRTLARAQKILIQAATDDKPFGWEVEPAVVDGKDGFQITDLGEPPLNVVNIEATVLLKGLEPAHEPVVSIVDPNGYARGTPITRFVPEGLEITLPKNALYTHVSLEREPGFFDSFEVYAGGWYFAEWFGYLQLLTDEKDWLWHLDHGYLAIVGTDPAGFWAFHLDFGWVYHSNHLYPWMYKHDTDEWLFYYEGSNRWFWSDQQGYVEIPRM